MTLYLFAGELPSDWAFLPTIPDQDGYLAINRSRSLDTPLLSIGQHGHQLTCRLAELQLSERVPAAEGVAISLPNDVLRSWIGDVDHMQSLVIDPTVAVMLTNFLDDLAARLPFLDSSQGDRLAPVLISHLAACIAPPSAVHDVTPAPVGNLLERALQIVRQRMAYPEFGPTELCRALGASRSKLYRVFEGSGGITNVINRERLREAHRRLSDVAATPYIYMIGNEVGFVDHSTFSRAFRREYGYTPKEARERALRGAGPAAEAPIQAALPDATVREMAARNEPSHAVRRQLYARRHSRRLSHAI